MNKLGAVALATITAASCGGVADESEDFGEATSAVAIPEGSVTAYGVLGFVNAADTTADDLVASVGLTKRVATAIAGHVRGRDGKHGTRDDDRFDTIRELDDIAGVGPATIEKIRAYADRAGLIPSTILEGVPLTTTDATTILDIANRATLDQLDREARVDIRAARAVVAARPIASLTVLGDVSYVGKTAVEKLRAYVTRWRPVVQPPAPCTLALTSRADADVEAYGAILDAATTRDYPWASLKGASLSACADFGADAGRTAIGDLLARSREIGWGVDIAVLPPTWSGVQVANGRFEALLRESRTVIEDRAGAGSYPDADALIAKLLAGVTASPTSYYEVTLSTDAEECSEAAVALIDTRSGATLIIHRFPRC